MFSLFRTQDSSKVPFYIYIYTYIYFLYLAKFQLRNGRRSRGRSSFKELSLYNSREKWVIWWPTKAKIGHKIQSERWYILLYFVFPNFLYIYKILITKIYISLQTPNQFKDFLVLILLVLINFRWRESINMRTRICLVNNFLVLATHLVVIIYLPNFIVMHFSALLFLLTCLGSFIFVRHC